MKTVPVLVLASLMLSSLLLAGFLAHDLLLDDGSKGAAAVTTRLRLGYEGPRSGRIREVLERFVLEVSRRSGDRIKVIIVDQDGRSGQAEGMRLAREGEWDLVAVSVSRLSEQLPSFKLLDFPFFFLSPEAVHRFLDGRPGRRMLGQLTRLDLQGLGYWEEGFLHLVTNRRVDQAEDMRRMRFGLQNVGLRGQMFASHGVTLVERPSGPDGDQGGSEKVDGWETLLTQGVVESLEKGPFHVTLSHHGWRGMVLAMGWPSYRGLPNDILSVLREAALEAGQWARQRSGAEQKRMEQLLNDAKVSVVQYTEPVRHAWFRKSRRFSQGYEEKWGAGLLAEIDESEMQASAGVSSGKGWIIGVDADYSNTSSPVAMAIKRGVRIAVDEINEAGGILDKPVTMIATDNWGSASVGVGNVHRLGQRWGAVAVVAGGGDTIVGEQIPAAKQEKMLMLVPHAAAVGWGNPGQDGREDDRHVFRVAANEYQKAMVFFDELAGIHGKVALMLENTTNGRKLRTFMTQMFWDQGKAKPMVVWFNVGQQVYLDPLRQMQKAGVTAFVLLAGAEETRRIRSAMDILSFQAKIFGFRDDYGGLLRSDGKSSIPDPDYRYIETFSLELSRGRTAGGDSFRRRYWNLFETPMADHVPDPSVSAQAYDLIMLLAQGLKRSSERGLESLSVAMERLDGYRGAIKYYSWPFSRMRHEGLTPADLMMVQYNVDGVRVPWKKFR
ncbi:MAG: TRAP transporter substrate-binding protein DctP [Magnetococcales bacterium]|nr:TRAP transporter substrate-binding protein DctP [Magnetococcales bacterium]